MEKVIGTTFMVIVTLALSTIIYGLTFQVLWGWFVVQTFRVPALSIPDALGLALTVSYLTKDYTASTNPEATAKAKANLRKAWYEGIAKAITVSLFVLLFGVVYHLFQ